MTYDVDISQKAWQVIHLADLGAPHLFFICVGNQLLVAQKRRCRLNLAGEDGDKGVPPCLCATLLVKRGVYILHGSDSFCLFLLHACSVRVSPSSSDCLFRMFPDSCCLKGQIISRRSPFPRSSHTNDVYVCVCVCVRVCGWPDPSTSAPSTDRHERFSTFNRCVKPHMQNGAWRTAARPHLVLHLRPKEALQKQVIHSIQRREANLHKLYDSTSLLCTRWPKPE